MSSILTNCNLLYSQSSINVKVNNDDPFQCIKVMTVYAGLYYFKMCDTELRHIQNLWESNMMNVHYFDETRMAHWFWVVYKVLYKIHFMSH